MYLGFESDNRNLTNTKLVLRGMAFILAAAGLVAVGTARSEGRFEHRVEVTALMSNLGDGLPPRSDVKYLGVLVGVVESVVSGRGDRISRVRIALRSDRASGIPATVTARVVPSNVFAVPSIQLVDNGPGPALRPGADIAEDRGLATVQLQTSLTALSRIAAAAGRSGTDPTVGILETVQRATNGRGAEAVEAAAQLERIVAALTEVASADGTASTLATLSTAIAGLRSAAPDLLAAVNQSVAPMRTLAEQRAQLARLLTGGLVTATTVGDGMVAHTATVTDITGAMAPVLDVLGRGSQNFVRMTTSQTRIAQKFYTEFWRADTQSATANVIIELTPHKLYSRADCPRYGELAGPSCVTGSEGPAVLGTGDGLPASRPAAAREQPPGNVDERAQIAEILGATPNVAAELLLGPLVRGNDVRVVPVDGSSAQPTGGVR